MNLYFHAYTQYIFVEKIQTENTKNSEFQMSQIPREYKEHLWHHYHGDEDYCVQKTKKCFYYSYVKKIRKKM